jgi:hypothetical protein
MKLRVFLRTDDPPHLLQPVMTPLEVHPFQVTRLHPLRHLPHGLHRR